ncbi:putative thiamine transport system permease protein [Cohaesibacter marisflavi]|uniref:Putative thiamine transport system permease protein n=1 Tax=Cohaesibacter marisflavi TaxID=655353 RepID=A0A1I5CXK4_9HYPH|nr:ABC transporter permease subunit [Cohaesibacter marisflavi]SFN91725.1 putative thiamine transport system permease protein [Cohaesibacter marisflavi]
MRFRPLHSAPMLISLLMLGPVLAGLLGALLPTFGWLPVLGGDSLTLEPVRALLATPGLARSIALSLASGLLATLLAMLMVIGLLSAWSGTRLFRWMVRMISPLLSIPHAATALGFAFLLAPSGWIVRMISPELTGWSRPPDWFFPHDPYGLAMIAGLTIKELPFLLLVSLAALPQIEPRRTQNLVRSLGYGPMVGWVHAVWPRLYRQIRLPIFAVIAYASSVVDVALILGPTNPPPLAVQLVRWMSDPNLSMRFLASAGAILQLLVTLAALGIWWGGERMASRLLGCLVQSGLRFQRDEWARRLAASLNVAAVLLMLLSLGGLVLWSFAGFWRFPDAVPVSLSLNTWMRQGPMLMEPLYNAVLIGGLATVVGIVMTLATLEAQSRMGKRSGRSAMVILYLPLIVPQVAFLFGLQLILLTVNASYALWALVFGHLIFTLPYIFLSLSDQWHVLDPRYMQMATALGRSAWAIFWRVRLPMLLRPILTAAAVGFAVSIGQYLPTLLIGGGRWETITTEAVALSAGGNRRLIGVYALMQMLLPFVGFLIATLIPTLFYKDRRGMTPADR